MRRAACLLLSLVLPALVSATPYDALAGDGGTRRSALQFNALQSGAAELVDYGAFYPPPGAGNPTAVFEGTLAFRGRDGVVEFSEIGTRMPSSLRSLDRLPDFEFEFVQHGTHLIPARRGLIVTSHPTWNYILEPGRVWQEAGDQGFTRAAIPFALQEKNANCTHNGVMSFAFNGQGQVSRVAYQITLETCQYFKFNAWGRLKASYRPHKVEFADAIRHDHEREVAVRLPTRPITALTTDFAASGVDVSRIASEQTPEHLTAFGVVAHGVHYVGGCESRSGTYPFCDVISLPSYSLAKSIVGGIGLMRLEQQYPGVANAIADWKAVPPCQGKQWADLTMLHLLDMSTGNYASKGSVVDEGSTQMLNNFFLAVTLQDKLEAACSYRRQAPPGTAWVYHTSDTFLLGTLMNAYFKSKAGADKDFYWDMLVPELWDPLQLSPAMWTTVRTADKAAQAFTGWGLTLHRDDIAKIGDFLNKSGGKLGGRQVLDKTLYDEALQRTANTGLPAGSPDSRYLHSFWRWNAAASGKGEAICPRDRWIPYLSGYGGIGLVLLPNGMIYYFVSDNQEYGFKNALIELNKIRSICE
jgi:hypothetical protein